MQNVMKPLTFENDLSVDQNIIKGMIKLFNTARQQLHVICSHYMAFVAENSCLQIF